MPGPGSSSWRQNFLTGRIRYPNYCVERYHHDYHPPPPHPHDHDSDWEHEPFEEWLGHGSRCWISASLCFKLIHWNLYSALSTFALHCESLIFTLWTSILLSELLLPLSTLRCQLLLCSRNVYSALSTILYLSSTRTPWCALRCNISKLHCQSHPLLCTVTYLCTTSSVFFKAALQALSFTLSCTVLNCDTVTLKHTVQHLSLHFNRLLPFGPHINALQHLVQIQSLFSLNCIALLVWSIMRHPYYSHNTYHFILFCTCVCLPLVLAWLTHNTSTS